LTCRRSEEHTTLRSILYGNNIKKNKHFESAINTTSLAWEMNSAYVILYFESLLKYYYYFKIVVSWIIKVSLIHALWIIKVLLIHESWNQSIIDSWVMDRWIFSWFESAQISKWSNDSRTVLHSRGTWLMTSQIHNSQLLSVSENAH
jgi:hypothetical protein